jgi:predicted O-methyltransferase YrrM
MRLPWREVDGISTSLTRGETAKLRRLAAGQVVLEIGSAYGYSAIQMAQAGARLVVAIDPHAGENPGSLERMQANVEARCLADRVAIWRIRSEHATTLLREGAFGLAFIDGDHSEQAVATDARMAWELLAPGGWLCCHDHGEDSCPGVAAALDAWRAPDELIDTLWIARKR